MWSSSTRQHAVGAGLFFPIQSTTEMRKEEIVKKMQDYLAIEHSLKLFVISLIGDIKQNDKADESVVPIALLVSGAGFAFLAYQLEQLRNGKDSMTDGISKVDLEECYKRAKASYANTMTPSGILLRHVNSVFIEKIIRLPKTPLLTEKSHQEMEEIRNNEQRNRAERTFIEKFIHLPNTYLLTDKSHQELEEYRNKQKRICSQDFRGQM